MKKAISFVVFVLMSLATFAQTTPLIVQLDNNNNPYLVHTVAAKENYYSIGRIYNISPRVYAPYNGLELATPMNIGYQVKIPLNEINFWQKGTRKDNEVVIPVYHIVKQGENVQRISQLFKTDNESVKSWNNLSTDAVAAGSKVIVGFLKVDKTLSPLASQGMSVRSEPNIVKQQPKPEVKKEEPKQEPPVVVKKEEPKPEVKPQPVKQDPPKVEVKKEEPKVDVAVVTYNGTGFFKDEFNRQTNNGKRTTSNSGAGSVFKSTSGWSDGKYYVLMDNVEKGSIIMIKNPLNGKAVYAKVLGGVEETSPGSGLLFRLSNSAAAQLGISTEKFNADLIWAN